MIEYEVIEDKIVTGTWRVEVILNTGEVLVTIFSGPDAKQRAVEYAWMRNNSTW